MIVFICVLGNILVVLSVFTYRPLQSVQNMFIVSLALADTFVACFVMPFHILLKFTDGLWIFNTIVCHFFLTIDILLCTASILHLCCIALDRYWAIKDSVKYAQKRTMRLVTIMLIVVWLSSMVISLPVIYWNTKTVRVLTSSESIISISSTVIISTAQQPSSQTSTIEETTATPARLPWDSSAPIIHEIVCGIPQDKLYRFYSSSGSFWVPLLIMTFVYVKIFQETKRRLHERAKAAQKLANTMARNQASMKNNEVGRCESREYFYKIFCYFCLLNKSSGKKEAAAGDEKTGKEAVASVPATRQTWVMRIDFFLSFLHLHLKMPNSVHFIKTKTDN